MTAYYNEFDPKAAAWLRELVARGLIAPGDVDERSIEDVSPDDLRGYEQCHFFAGIGVWSHALRSAGWADDRPVWTGSCPCQPFSAAGKGGGFDDERHLWPAFHYLIEQCRPAVVFGEQVASKDGLAWLDLVQADLEGTGYACGALDTCAAGFGAPHIRQRLYWVADADDQRPQGRRRDGQRPKERFVGSGSLAGGLADGAEPGREPRRRDSGQGDGRGAPRVEPGRLRDAGGLADASSERRQQVSGRASSDEATHGRGKERNHVSTSDGQDLNPGPTNGLWRDADWLFCRDGKWRPVEPGTFPLAHGAAARVGRLRGYGNGLVAPAAQAFIEAYLETEAEADERIRLSEGVFA